MINMSKKDELNGKCVAFLVQESIRQKKYKKEILESLDFKRFRN